MRSEASRTARESTHGAWLLLAALGLVACGGTADAGEEPLEQITSPYVDDHEPGPMPWVCDIPISASWHVYAPNQDEYLMHECLGHADYDAWVQCTSLTGRGCCVEQMNAQSITTMSTGTNGNGNCAGVSARALI